MKKTTAVLVAFLVLAIILAGVFYSRSNTLKVQVSDLASQLAAAKNELSSAKEAADSGAQTESAEVDTSEADALRAELATVNADNDELRNLIADLRGEMLTVKDEAEQAQARIEAAAELLRTAFSQDQETAQTADLVMEAAQETETMEQPEAAEEEEEEEEEEEVVVLAVPAVTEETEDAGETENTEVGD